MIKEFEYFHGAVLSRLIHGSDIPVTLEKHPTPSNSSYVVNGSIGMYIKYSTKRMSPWTYSFSRQHQDEIKEMKAKYGRVYLVLVCERDGIVVLEYEELKNILDEVHEETEWISIARGARQMYLVKGSDGRLPYKAGKSEFPKKLLAE